MRKILGTWVPIGLLVLILATVYFRQWFMTARAIRENREAQGREIAMLSKAKDSLQDIANQSIALRVKLYGPDAAGEAVLSATASASGNQTPGATRAATLPPSVISAMKRHAVRIVHFRQTDKSSEVQMESGYDEMVKFLGAAGPDLPRVDGFLMERAEKNQVRLTLTLST